MHKIIIKIMLCALVFSGAPVQAIGLNSLWSKHSSTILTSLYILGSALLVYDSYKYSEFQLKKLKKSKNPQATEIEQWNNRPTEVGMALLLTGGLIKLYSMGFFNKK